MPARLNNREIDLAIINSSDVRVEDEMEVQPLLPHPAMLVCRANHPLSKIAVPSAREVFAFPLAAPNLPEGASEQLLSHLPPEFRAAVTKRGLMRITCDSSSVLKSVISHSDALTVMNAFMVLDELRSGKLITIPGIQMGVGGQFGVVRLRRRTLSAAAQRFTELLLAHDAELAKEEQEYFNT